MELHNSRRGKLSDRIRKGRPICIQGYIREYRKKQIQRQSLPRHCC